MSAYASVIENSAQNPMSEEYRKALFAIVQLDGDMRSARSMSSTTTSASGDDAFKISAVRSVMFGTGRPQSALIRSDASVFLRTFDALSVPKSYRQSYMENNAFLVYYTGGYDGPGRPRMEEYVTDAEDMHAKQAALRNDAWAAVDVLVAELNYVTKADLTAMSPSDIAESWIVISSNLEEASKAVESFLNLVPQQFVKEARESVIASTNKS
eukprot:CAMPEP_0113321328 /NCGR_PEP_ID=MMETSP0010_2-20120614/14853_1 /TAXON_ID=216773 ORGANISM="Corethron hystrix, Strain 308" /NCGR_SAMPLE_ID=MMETSP0010_2 /ASSEMBLY_ACC=CAM_ASM_000155 /LENGTH=211 /DNA_ID=CAMNT_0000179433 /DNA_START=301 /DNA_END=939 /DNA_ORIENTATION=+ /assembly_acc=CAM_ASM_000155